MPKEKRKASPKSTIEEASRRIARAVDRFRSGELNDRAIVVLLHDSTGLPKKTIELCLSGIAKLPEHFLKQDDPNKT